LTGCPPVVINGVTELGTAIAMQAQTDATAAYAACKSEPYTVDMTGIDLASEILGPAVYKFSSTAGITAGGILTLTGEGIYIFQVGSAISTGANIKIVVENGANVGCIFWEVGSSVTHGANSQFLGNILPYASVTFGSNVTYRGSIYAQTGTVIFIEETVIHEAGCDCQISLETLKDQTSGYPPSKHSNIYFNNVSSAFVFKIKKLVGYSI
jgi:hypothetical protein